MTLRERLRALRKERKMTLLQVAEATHLSFSYISDLERGKTNPSMDTLARLAACYGLSRAQLMFGIQEWETPPQEQPILVPELASLIQQGLIDEQTAQDLNRIEIRGKHPQTEEQWLQLYLFLSQMLKFPLQPEVIDEAMGIRRRVSKTDRRDGAAQHRHRKSSPFEAENGFDQKVNQSL